MGSERWDMNELLGGVLRRAGWLEAQEAPYWMGVPLTSTIVKSSAILLAPGRRTKGEEFWAKTWISLGRVLTRTWPSFFA